MIVRPERRGAFSRRPCPLLSVSHLALIVLGLCVVPALSSTRGNVGNDENGNFVVNALEGRTVFINGVDVNAELSSCKSTQESFSPRLAAMLSKITALEATVVVSEGR